jgi:ribosome-binding protein aMBF1 (putative translation factor)
VSVPLLGILRYLCLTASTSAGSSVGDKVSRVSDRNSYSSPDDSTLEEARRRLAERMVQLRTEAGMSQREAARRGGMNQRNWSRIEQKKLHPRLDSLLRIQYALHVDSLEGLFGPQATRDILRHHKPSSRSQSANRVPGTTRKRPGRVDATSR